MMKVNIYIYKERRHIIPFNKCGGQGSWWVGGVLGIVADKIKRPIWQDQVETTSKPKMTLLGELRMRLVESDDLSSLEGSCGFSAGATTGITVNRDRGEGSGEGLGKNSSAEVSTLVTCE